MCGILGIWSKGPASDQTEFDGLFHTLAHRGPDESWSSKFHNFQYGATRLAIVDAGVSLSDDSESETTDVLLNGEIWNYRDLAQRYGVEPVSERRVIRELYERVGLEFICHLDGVFAAVIVDKARQQIHVCRDPVGVKPAFWWTDSSRRAFIFSSDVKTICQWKRFNPEVNEEYLINEHVVGFSDYEENLFNGIRQIKPGSCLTLSIRGDSLGTTVSEYESLLARQEPVGWSEKCHLDVLQQAVWDQYKHCDRLPIGLLLSGGVDSSLLLFIARSMGLREIVCFYCGSDTSPDYYWANRVSREAGYEIRNFNLSASQVWTELASSCYYMSGTNSLLPHLCRKIKTISPEIRVLWSGEGADELFGGYPCHGNATGLLQSWQEKIARTKRRTALANRVEQIWAMRLDELNLRMEIFKLYREEQLVNAHLVAHDYAGMAASVEIRLPFLDLHNVALARCIPATLVSGSLRKEVLKNLLRSVSGISDDSFYNRTKIGLLHGYIEVVCELRQLAQLLEQQPGWADMQTAYCKGPFQRIWYQLVHRVFAGPNRCGLGSAYQGGDWQEEEVAN